MHNPNLNELQDILGYQFKDQNILSTALTHRSKLNEAGTTQSYERLEFLGDAVLEMLISSYFFTKCPDKMEGYLTSARSATVRTESLAQIARQIKLGQFIFMSKGEEQTGGRNNSSTLEDVVESIIGALFSDGGIAAAEGFFERFVVPMALNVLSQDNLKDAKSNLQEKVQSHGLQSPIYQTVKETGPDHDKIFDVSVFINGKELATGTGKNKQEAEQQAAQKALELV